MWIKIEPERVRVSLTSSLQEISVVQNESIDSITSNPERLHQSVQFQSDYLLHHLHLKSGDRLLFGKSSFISESPEGNSLDDSYFQFEFEFPVSYQRTKGIEISHTMLQEWPYAPGVPWRMIYVIQSKTLDAPEVESRPLELGETVTIGVEEASNLSRWSLVFDYFRLGIIHILTGYDHLLFVSALVVLATRFWEIFKVISAFTFAHTLTLVLSVFDLFRLPSSIVEPIISLSIIIVSIDNLRKPENSTPHLRLGIAFGFGLIHGLGFAGGLLETMRGLGTHHIWTTLASFSLGVEVGHQIVVLPLLFFFFWLRRSKKVQFYHLFARIFSIAIAVGGIYFLLMTL